MRASRGMGCMAKDKIPGSKGKTIVRKDKPQFVKEYKKGGPVKQLAGGGGLYANIAAKKKRIASGSGESMRSTGSKGAPKKSDFAKAAKTASYKEGGVAKSKVNAAGNYTKPEMRKRIFNAVKAEATAGTGAGQWSARKAQVVAKRYKAAGGGYK